MFLVLTSLSSSTSIGGFEVVGGTLRFSVSVCSLLLLCSVRQGFILNCYCVHGGAGYGGFMPAGFEVVVTDDDVDIAAPVCLCGEFAPTHASGAG